jgi:hypothetical protein
VNILVYAFGSVTQIIIWYNVVGCICDVSCSPRHLALPLDAPPYTLFMSKLTMTDNAAQLLQWKQFVSTCCENQFE